jgi:hypothetical protein
MCCPTASLAASIRFTNCSLLDMIVRGHSYSWYAP